MNPLQEIHNIVVQLCADRFAQLFAHSRRIRVCEPTTEHAVAEVRRDLKRFVTQFDAPIAVALIVQSMSTECLIVSKHERWFSIAPNPLLNKTQQTKMYLTSAYVCVLLLSSRPVQAQPKVIVADLGDIFWL
jgi:hypothetical protein